MVIVGEILGCPKRPRPSRCVCSGGNVEHPKDIGDRSTLAIALALRAFGYGLYLPFREHTMRSHPRTRRLARSPAVRDGTTKERRSCIQRMQQLRPPHELSSQEADVRRRDRLLRRLLPRDGRRLLRAHNRSTGEVVGIPARRPADEQPVRPHPVRVELRNRTRRYRRTSRPCWCWMILRFTRWRALSIVFVSQPSCSAMTS